MIIGRGVEKFIDIVGEILAMATMVLVVLLFANAKWGFIGADAVKVLEPIKNFAIVAVLGLKSLEFALKRNVIFFIICAAVIVVAFVFVFVQLF